MKYPGFYIHDAAAGTVVPQFQPLYPVLLALVISLAGERAALFLNPALALAGVLLLYRVACLSRGRTHGLVAAALLALNVVQVWNARFSTSEVAAQALLLAGFVFLADFLEDGDPAAGALSGLAFGLATAATVTTVLVVPFALAAAVRPGGGRAARPFVAALALALAQAALWSALIAPEYLASVTGFFPGLRRTLPVAVPALAALAWLGWVARGRLAAACASRAAAAGARRRVPPRAPLVRGGAAASRTRRAGARAREALPLPDAGGAPALRRGGRRDARPGRAARGDRPAARRRGDALLLPARAADVPDVPLHAAPLHAAGDTGHRLRRRARARRPALRAPAGGAGGRRRAAGRWPSPSRCWRTATCCACASTRGSALSSPVSTPTCPRGGSCCAKGGCPRISSSTRRGAAS